MASKRGQRRRKAHSKPPMLTGEKLRQAHVNRAARQRIEDAAHRHAILGLLDEAFPNPYKANAEQVLAELDRMEAEDDV